MDEVILDCQDVLGNSCFIKMRRNQNLSLAMVAYADHHNVDCMKVVFTVKRTGQYCSAIDTADSLGLVNPETIQVSLR